MKTGIPRNNACRRLLTLLSLTTLVVGFFFGGGGGRRRDIFYLSPTNNALLISFPTELRRRNFVAKHGLSIQIGAKRAKMHAMCDVFQLSFHFACHHRWLGGTVVFQRLKRKKNLHTRMRACWKSVSMLCYKGDDGKDERKKDRGDDDDGEREKDKGKDKDKDKASSSSSSEVNSSDNPDECTCGVAKPSRNASPVERNMKKSTQNKIVNGYIHVVVYCFIAVLVKLVSTMQQQVRPSAVASLDGHAGGRGLAGTVRREPGQPLLRPHGRPLLLLRQRGRPGALQVRCNLVDAPAASAKVKPLPPPPPQKK